MNSKNIYIIHWMYRIKTIKNHLVIAWNEIWHLAQKIKGFLQNSIFWRVLYIKSQFSTIYNFWYTTVIYIDRAWAGAMNHHHCGIQSGCGPGNLKFLIGCAGVQRVSQPCGLSKGTPQLNLLNLLNLLNQLYKFLKLAALVQFKTSLVVFKTSESL